eukprot:15139078-Ditylum_brightwellii.AAC.1
MRLPVVSERVIASRNMASTMAPYYLCRKETMDIVRSIQLSAGSNDDQDFLLASDKRKLNCCGNREGSKFETFWDAAERVIELDGSGVHRRHHDAGNLQKTVNVVYTPHINSIQQLQAVTIKLLVEEDKLKEGVDFHIPRQKWLMLQLSPNDETRKTAEFYTDHLPIKRQL